MVSYSRTDMKIPVRPAPLPPSNSSNRGLQRSSTIFDSWNDGNDDPFERRNFTRSMSVQLDQPPNVKKKPPPRPPPPKFNQKNQGRQTSSRPSNVLSGLFSRQAAPRTSVNSAAQRQTSSKEPYHFTTSLIDLHSPSSSPTPTTRSSSDGVSVNSFGSDGSTSNNGHTPNGGNVSIFESGFEDDFDFFGGLSSSNVKTSAIQQKDLCNVPPQDPFSPPRQQTSHNSNPPATKFTENSLWFDSDIPTESIFSDKDLANNKTPAPSTSMPTIIRAKPNRPPVLPKNVRNIENKLTNRQEPIERVQTFSASTLSNTRHTFEVSSHTLGNGGFEDDSLDWSPPMPSIPPPPPPPEALQELEAPDIPPRPFQPQMTDQKTPCGIALYDYPASHPDDLAFRANDVIFITKQVNAEWMYGQVDQRQGMFPCNFIKVIVPLGDLTVHEPKSVVHRVTALYPFVAESWEDLDFPEGAVIKVLGQVNANWLYGEFGGKTGQFPSSFVDHIPTGLPQRRL